MERGRRSERKGVGEGGVSTAGEAGADGGKGEERDPPRSGGDLPCAHSFAANRFCFWKSAHFAANRF